MKYFNIFKGRVGDLVQKHYAGRKSLHMSIALIKLSGVNVFISSVEGVGSKKTLSNQNVRSEHYDRLSYLGKLQLSCSSNGRAWCQQRQDHGFDSQGKQELIKCKTVT